jgi:hypothetical protein
MAQPQIPIQTGGNLPGLDREEDIQEATQQEADMQAYEEELGLDPSEVEEEVIELEEIRYKKYLELQKNDNFDSLAVR